MYETFLPLFKTPGISDQKYIKNERKMKWETAKSKTKTASWGKYQETKPK